MGTKTAELLSADTSMGAVTLLVGDLTAMTAYYRDAITLSVISETPTRVVMGRNNLPLVILELAPELKHASRRQAGLFHTAILFETQADLAAAIYSVATRYPGTFIGSADHLVSQAFYFSDPEGNGVELYWDRARTEWSWVHGRVEMDSLMLDPNAFMRDHLNEQAVEEPHQRAATVGHVHLQVGDIANAKRFYVDQLGFETTATKGTQALFVSAGGYHHHMAMNTWNSAGAGPRPKSLGLGTVRLELPSSDDMGELDERLSHYGVATRNDGATLAFEDPWLNRVQVSTQA
ncbi:VOC family protein [Kocuria sp. JC486]|uniref:VOC family protein n=1 Tax=Kocuria sp. JC486 TaxID=1970736 RepID=UPI00141E332A|nr:VOC family protein [Kocuria sp. JC486]NHU86070.1 VOC family protein [Kocuria sp. JC486]